MERNENDPKPQPFKRLRGDDVVAYYNPAKLSLDVFFRHWQFEQNCSDVSCGRNLKDFKRPSNHKSKCKGATRLRRTVKEIKRDEKKLAKNAEKGKEKKSDTTAAATSAPTFGSLSSTSSNKLRDISPLVKLNKQQADLHDGAKSTAKLDNESR